MAIRAEEDAAAAEERAELKERAARANERAADLYYRDCEPEDRESARQAWVQARDEWQKAKREWESARTKWQVARDRLDNVRAAASRGVPQATPSTAPTAEPLVIYVVKSDTWAGRNTEPDPDYSPRPAFRTLTGLEWDGNMEPDPPMYRLSPRPVSQPMPRMTLPVSVSAAASRPAPRVNNAPASGGSTHVTKRK